MADYFVKSSGSDANDGLSWATAKATLHTATTGALAVATASGDRIFVKYDDAFTLSASTTFTAANNISIIAVSSTNYTTGTNWTPAAMDGTAGYIGHTSSSYGITISTSTYKVYLYGLYFRTAGTTATAITVGNSDGSHISAESCVFYIGSTSTSTSSYIAFGGATSLQNSYTLLVNCNLRFGATQNKIIVSGRFESIGGSVLSGSVPSTLLGLGSSSPNVDTIKISGCDLSLLTNTTLLGNMTQGAISAAFDNCKLPSSYTMLASQTLTNKSSGAVWLFNCSSGDNHFELGYADAFGTLTAVTTPYFTSGATYDGTNAVCWKIVTTADCSFSTPFVTPWIEKYHSGTSAITPYLEILRNDSTTAFNNDAVWGEFSAQATSGSVLPVFKNGRRALEASAAAQANGAGLASWTGEGGSAWSGKIDSGSSVTPAEIGMLRARVCVGLASATVYVDPYIRT